MSDSRLRDLERRWKETGAPDDEAAYLLERVRVGDLTRERLELAAYCGHEGARRATGSTSAMRSPADLASAVRGLDRFGTSAVDRATVALARVVLDLRARHDPPPSEEEMGRARAVVESMDAWLHCPCDDHLAENWRCVLTLRRGPSLAFLADTCMCARSKGVNDAIDACIRLAEAGHALVDPATLSRSVLGAVGASALAALPAKAQGGPGVRLGLRPSPPAGPDPRAEGGRDGRA